jgi:hypothetical protein
MAAFTDEQVKILIAAFEHVWARINALHSNVTEDTVRLAALTSFLELQGTIDEEQATSVAEEFHDEGSSDGEMTTAPGFAGDKALTERILRGEVDAGRRQREAEERARQEDRD